MPTNSDASAARPEQRLVLAYPRPPAPTGVLDWLAQRFDLETYGDSLLTRGARSGLRTQAALLTVVYLFDTAVWAVMFNMLFGLGYLRLGWHTLLALLGALTIALVMFFWERTIATLDLQDGIGIGTRVGIVVRVGIIGVVAVATALPLELLLFKDEIRQRAYEEAVRHEFVVKVREHKELAELVKAKTDEKAALVAAGPNAGDFDPQRQQRLAELKRDESQLRREAGTNRDSFRAAQNDEERKSLEARDRSTSREWQKVRDEISSLESILRQDQTETHARKLAAIQADIDCKSERIRVVNGWLEKIRKNDFARHPEIRERHTLRSCAAVSTSWAAAETPTAPEAATAAAQPGGSDTPVDAEAPAAAVDDDPSRLEFYLGVPALRIFDQLRILWALQHGHPPEWREADDELVRDLQKDYNLKDKPSSATRIYEAFAGMALLVGIAIPLMSLMFKLTGNPETKNYYSLEAQARAGNPEALQVIASRSPAITGAAARA